MDNEKQLSQEIENIRAKDKKHTIWLAFVVALAAAGVFGTLGYLLAFIDNKFERIEAQSAKLERSLKEEVERTKIVSEESLTKALEQLDETSSIQIESTLAAQKRTILDNARRLEVVESYSADWGRSRKNIGYGNAPHRHTSRAVNCPDNHYVSGLKVEYRGTCRDQCDKDGGIIGDIVLTCTSIILSANK